MGMGDVIETPGLVVVTVTRTVVASTALAQDTTVAPPKKRATRAAESRPKAPEPVWPVPMPDPIDGSILPAKRIVAFYGNPLSKRMGVLGEYAPDTMLAKLDTAVRAWEKADPTTPVQPALHLIATVAQGSAGRAATGVPEPGARLLGARRVFATP